MSRAGRIDVAFASRSLLGEGPVWDGSSGSLYWIDIEAARLSCGELRTGAYRSTQLPETPGAVVLTHDGRLAGAFQSGFAYLLRDGSGLSPIASIHAPDSGLRMNDGKCDGRGRFWAGSMYVDPTTGFGSLYRLDGANRATPVVGETRIANGLGWSPDDTLMYFIDTLTQRVDVFDFDVGTGAVSGRRTFCDLRSEDGVPDGLAVDSEGRLWVAMCFAGRVLCIDTEGAVVSRLDVPVSMPTSVAFGGESLRLLFVTTARKGLTDIELVEQPLAGSVLVTDVGVAGLPVAKMADPVKA